MCVFFVLKPNSMGSCFILSSDRKLLLTFMLMKNWLLRSNDESLQRFSILRLSVGVGNNRVYRKVNRSIK